MQIGPVDGAGPSEDEDAYCITPGEDLSWEMPVLVMASGYDHVSGIPSSENGLLKINPDPVPFSRSHSPPRDRLLACLCPTG